VNFATIVYQGLTVKRVIKRLLPLKVTVFPTSRIYIALTGVVLRLSYTTSADAKLSKIKNVDIKITITGIALNFMD
jgi:hypothetical protein